MADHESVFRMMQKKKQKQKATFTAMVGLRESEQCHIGGSWNF